MSLRQLNVTNTYVDAKSRPTKVEVKFTPTSELRSVGKIILDTTVQAWTDASGKISVQLYPQQPGLEPSYFLYRVEEYYKGKLIRPPWYLRLSNDMPDEVSITGMSPLADYIPELPPQGVTEVDVRSIIGDAIQAVWDFASATAQSVASVAALMPTKLGNSDIGVKVPGLVNGKIPSQHIPSLNVGEYRIAADQNAMLSLPSIRGTVAYRNDLGYAMMLTGHDSSVLSDWVPFTPVAEVLSVNGLTGAVVISPVTIGAAPDGHTHQSLVGHTYAATYMESAENRTRTVHRFGEEEGPQVEITYGAIIFRDAAGEVLWELNPHTGAGIPEQTE